MHLPGIPCPFRSITGLPCPLCGMTRASLAALRGHEWASLRFQPAALVLAAVAVYALARRKREWLRPPLWAVSTGLALMWVWNLTLNPTFH